MEDAGFTDASRERADRFAEQQLGIGVVDEFADGAVGVGGSGGADSQLVAFRATPTERVTVTPRDQQGKATFNFEYNIDARGAQSGVAAELRASLIPIMREQAFDVVKQVERRGL